MVIHQGGANLPTHQQGPQHLFGYPIFSLVVLSVHLCQPVGEHTPQSTGSFGRQSLFFVLMDITAPKVLKALRHHSIWFPRLMDEAGRSVQKQPL